MRPHERTWPAFAAVVAIIGLQLFMPREVGPSWWPVLVGLQVALIVPLAVANPMVLHRYHPLLRATAVTLAVVLIIANGIRLGQMLLALLDHQPLTGGRLIGAGLLIWSTNVVATAMAFWELDRGGPFARDPRHAPPQSENDLLFPQMTGVPGVDADTWLPSYVDYLFVAFTTATAFSPTDTLPLTGRAKLLMVLSSSISLATIAVVAARAVNVL